MRDSYASGWLVKLVQNLLTIWHSHDKNMMCHKDLNKCAYQHYQEIFLDGKVDNLVYITLVKLVLVQSGICGFEVIQRAQLL